VGERDSNGLSSPWVRRSGWFEALGWNGHPPGAFVTKARASQLPLHAPPALQRPPSFVFLLRCVFQIDSLLQPESSRVGGPSSAPLPRPTWRRGRRRQRRLHAPNREAQPPVASGVGLPSKPACRWCHQALQGHPRWPSSRPAAADPHLALSLPLRPPVRAMAATWDNAYNGGGGDPISPSPCSMEPDWPIATANWCWSFPMGEENLSAPCRRLISPTRAPWPRGWSP